MTTPGIKMQRLIEALSEIHRQTARGSPVDLGLVRTSLDLAQELDLDRKDVIYAINWGMRHAPSQWRERERREWLRDRNVATALPNGEDGEDAA